MTKVSVNSINADWGSVADRAPWGYVTSAQLAPILGVHLQTVNNWKLRGILPRPEENNPALRGNKNYYRISAIRAWLEGKSEDEINTGWLQSYMNAPTMTRDEFNFYRKNIDA